MSIRQPIRHECRECRESRERHGRSRLATAVIAAAVALLLAAGQAEARRPGGGHTYSGSSHASGHSSSGMRLASNRPGGGHTFSGSRPGGGHTFSGGSSRGGSFGSGPHLGGAPLLGAGGCGIGGCFMLLVLIVVVLIVLYMINKSRGGGGPPAPPAGQGPQGPPPTQDLEAIRGLDPEFSVVLFEDFAYALYAKAHESRANRQELDALAPYLSAEARAELASRPPAGAPVSGVVIGAMRAVDLRLPSGSEPRPQVGVALEFESNMTVGAGTGDATQYVRERWRLVRDAAVRSRPPQVVHSFHCPNCGAPFGPGGGDRCEYCGEVVSGGRFDWSVVATEPLEIESRPPALTGTVEEVGNDWPTIVHPALAERWAELQQADPASGEQALAARLQLIYTELNPAWTALDLRPVRGFVSDGLFDYLQYWIAAYQHQGLSNQLRDMRLTRRQLAKVVRDRHYDAVTFRIWASGRDFTVRQANGEVVGGNPNADRDYSEYWTMIRGAGVRGAPRADKNCPNCGAPLDVNMAGQCTHCDAKITSGEFDWVLSKIEQDESYTG
ncbi:MAG TPA: TIM44-like domain-containing protein [Thermoanaerobaculia bacterium]|nr:TIM44-like domain-containing protein [Thermoanaerobaculia bacterium]